MENVKDCRQKPNCGWPGPRGASLTDLPLESAELRGFHPTCQLSPHSTVKAFTAHSWPFVTLKKRPSSFSTWLPAQTPLTHFKNQNGQFYMLGMVVLHSFGILQENGNPLKFKKKSENLLITENRANTLRNLKKVHFISNAHQQKGGDPSAGVGSRPCLWSALASPD